MLTLTLQDIQAAPVFYLLTITIQDVQNAYSYNARYSSCSCNLQLRSTILKNKALCMLTLKMQDIQAAF